MSDNKKYYYLKMKDTFFDSEEMKILESMKNGTEYQNLYLKMCLLSLKNEGALLFKDAIPYDITMLSTVLRINIDTVKTGVEILAKFGLIDILENGLLYMSDIQTLIGKSSTEAERIRQYREKIKQKAVECNNSVQMYENCTPEKEIDIEKEIEKEITPDKPAKPKKHRHGEYKHVLLTSDEYLRLCEEWGEPELLRMIKELDEGIEAKGYKYKNHNLAIREWKKNSRGTPIPKHSLNEAPKCPKCGKKLSALFCDNCMIQFNSQLEEL